jgi:transposase
LRVKHLSADGAYDRFKLMDKASYLDFVVEVIRRSDQQQSFKVLPRRWVVERTSRMDDPVALIGPGLREAHRRLTRHDPSRHGRNSRATKRPPMIFQTES